VDTPAIAIDGLKKRFGKVEALRGIDLQVRPSTVLGLAFATAGMVLLAGAKSRLTDTGVRAPRRAPRT